MNDPLTEPDFFLDEQNDVLAFGVEHAILLFQEGIIEEEGLARIEKYLELNTYNGEGFILEQAKTFKELSLKERKEIERRVFDIYMSLF
jgi:hypothetical protein